MSRVSKLLFGNVERSSHRTALKCFWALVVAIPVFTILFFAGLSFTDLPSVVELENPKNNEASRILASDESVLGRYYLENRVMIDFDELSPELEKALVATEDERYYEHSGIDYRAIGRAVVFTGILGRESSGGGSTISQQLAKLLFTGPAASNIVERAFEKLKEWIIAVRLERKYTKQEIIAMYLNRYDFINGAQGIRAASENYFGKSPAELNTQEAATLVGMLKNASLYNPLRRPELVRDRRNTVLAQMVRNDFLTDAEFQELKETPLAIRFSQQKHDDGIAPYFRMVLKQEAKRILAQPQYHKADGQVYNIDRDGLTFYTTINPDMQRHAEEQARIHMKGLQREFFRHWRKLDPWTYESPSSETEVPLELRAESLKKDIRKSDRYQAFRAAYLTEPMRKINQKSDLTFHQDDREVERMVRDSEEGRVISELVRRDLISKKLAGEYRRVIKMDEFAELKTAWTEMQGRRGKKLRNRNGHARLHLRPRQHGNGYDDVAAR